MLFLNHERGADLGRSRLAIMYFYEILIYPQLNNFLFLKSTPEIGASGTRVRSQRRLPYQGSGRTPATNCRGWSSSDPSDRTGCRSVPPLSSRTISDLGMRVFMWILLCAWKVCFVLAHGRENIRMRLLMIFQKCSFFYNCSLFHNFINVHSSFRIWRIMMMRIIMIRIYNLIYPGTKLSEVACIFEKVKIFTKVLY